MTGNASWRKGASNQEYDPNHPDPSWPIWWFMRDSDWEGEWFAWFHFLYQLVFSLTLLAGLGGGLLLAWVSPRDAASELLFDLWWMAAVWLAIFGPFLIRMAIDNRPGNGNWCGIVPLMSIARLCHAWLRLLCWLFSIALSIGLLFLLYIFPTTTLLGITAIAMIALVLRRPRWPG
ncbi:MAG: hypothetical protein AB7I50_22140 [Vicinamibacterales bacterium]